MTVRRLQRPLSLGLLGQSWRLGRRAGPAHKNQPSPSRIAVMGMPSTRSRTRLRTDTAANTPNSSSATHDAPTKATDDWLANTRSHDHSPWKNEEVRFHDTLAPSALPAFPIRKRPMASVGSRCGDSPRYTAAQSRRTPRTIDQDGSVVHACLPARGSSMTGSALAPARRSARKGDIGQGFPPTPPASGLVVAPLGTTT